MEADCGGRGSGEPAGSRERPSAAQEDGYICSLCGQSFGQYGRLERHLAGHRPDPGAPSAGRPHQCPSQLRRHRRTRPGERPHRCPECGQELGPAQERPLRCGLCGRRFAQRSALGVHTLFHTAERKRRESQERGTEDARGPPGGAVGRRPRWLEYLEGPKRFSCPVCGKGFEQNSRLRLHLRVHTGERPLTCADCGKSFSNSSNLRKHERTHTGEKPFECPACGKGFSQSSTLVAHERTHTGEKPFKCPVCGADFNKQCNLRKHERTHTGEKPFECPACGKGFVDPSSLRNHKGTHMGEKPFPCPLCAKAFSNPSSLRKHRRAHGPDAAGALAAI